MSWWARSIANSLKFDDDDGDDVTAAAAKSDPNRPDSDNDGGGDSSPSRGVKEDLSELSKTLTRQFWGVASFLAPPPQQPEREPDPEGPILGIRTDFAEIGGRFRSGISKLSSNINVSEITKLASNLLQLESDDEGEGSGAVGVTEEVVAFARDIAMHPETWLDFPLPENVGDSVDFDMSDAQQEHALAVERLAPRLAALRLELCPGYMSESSFWKIYFVLLHPRLDKEDAILLSTPEIMEARALLAHELKKQNTTKPVDLSGKKSLGPEENVISHHEEPLSVPPPVLPDNVSDKVSGLNTDILTVPPISETENKPLGRNEAKSVDKPVIVGKDVGKVEDEQSKSGSLNVSGERDEDEDGDDWLKEETSEISGAVENTIPIENEDDVSFSDLEEEDDGDAPTSFRKSNYSSSDKESRDWVQIQ